MGDEDVFEEDEDAAEDGNELRPETPSRRTSRPAVVCITKNSTDVCERDFMTTDTTETESLDLGIIDDNDDDDDRMSIDPDVFKTPMSERQVRHLDSFRETRAYSEVPSRTEIVYTSPTYSNYKDPKDHFQRFPKRENGNHVLERAKSASRIQSIRRIETAILRRQNTDSKLNVKRINVLNEQSKKEPIKTNANGLSCKHINIDLDYQNVGPSAKFESYSRDLLRRPKTALTFNERYTQLAKERMKEQEMSESPDPFVSIIDLTRSLKGNSAGYPENPELSLRHSGYKSVWPLARVKSARNQRINQGKNIELNSISRRLERTPIAWQSFESDTPRYDVQKGLTGHHGRNQAVITLEIPNLAQSKKNVKRMSPLSGLLPRTKLRG
ncbi:hypothetical protein FSP39_014010 [Pinctada imbricata]|uniref:Uncharacterized protein n=1 Tax=Pinctada imbricata TaxID=66713 RepID=A0AA88Y2J4_PINIB|nr:hypothetical protein FSP39_014010 [Pinctada imbricata]